MSEGKPTGRRKRLFAGLAIAALAAGLALWLPKLQREGSATAREAVQEMYESVKDGDYKNLTASKEAVAQLQSIERQGGVILSFQMGSVATQLWGRPSDVSLTVRRSKGQFREICHLGDSRTVSAVSQQPLR